MMGSFYAGVGCLAFSALIVISLAIYSVGFFGALAAFGLAALICGLLYAGLTLIGP